MSAAKSFVLANALRRRAAMSAVAEAPEGYRVEVREPKRTDDMNAKFHAIVGDIAASGMEWAGKRRSAAQWKVLMVSAHAHATKEGSEICPGLEGEFVSIRESTALMSVRRGSSLIEYATSWCAMNGVRLRAPELEGEPA